MSLLCRLTRDEHSIKFCLNNILHRPFSWEKQPTIVLKKMYTEKKTQNSSYDFISDQFQS